MKKMVNKNLNKIKEAVKESGRKFKKKTTGHKILIVMLFLAVILMAMILCFTLYIIITAPDFETDLLYNKESSVLLSNDGTEFARLGSENRELVSYDELPQVLVDAIVATEDSRFFQHNGFDIARFIKASFGQLAGNSGAGGASTLTMQVVKNTYTSSNNKGFAGIIRKFTDIYMSVFKVEKKYTKEEIIEFYVNAPWLGSGSWGVEQASQLYFGKSIKDLSLPEAALIAGIFNNPVTLNPFTDITASTKRRNTVLDLMYKHGYITEEQLNDAKSISVQSLVVENKGKSLNKYQSFIDAVVDEVSTDTGMNPYEVPMEIQTTMDTNAQDTLNSLNNGDLYKFRNDVIQVGIAVTDVNNGAVLAVDGGRNQTTERSFNRATQMSRQPGSTAKPIFDYGPLIEYNNASTGTYFFDDEMTYSNGTSVSDADRKYQGQETMRSALSNSRNIPAIQAFQQLDKDKIATFAHSLGIDYGDNLYESCAIGGFDGVSPLELAAAYGAFARGGYYIQPYTYTKIKFKDTNEVTEQKPKKEKVMSEETAYMINSILITAQNNSVGGNFTINGTDVAAKTGTSTYDAQALKEKGVPSSASADNWDITYSPDYVISLWYGYDKLTKEYYTDSNVAAGDRKKIMTAISKKIYKTNSKFEKPSGVVSVEVEKDSVPLQLPSEYTPSDMRITELFKSGTEPTDVSIRYAKIDSPTNGKATTSGSTITLSWNGVTANAIDPTYLQNDFNTNYGQFATSYYNKRLSYNNSSIGYLGYQVYLKSGDSLTPLGYVNTPTYTYNTNGVGGNYTFVVKAQYSIFKDNASDGLSISSSAEGTNAGTTTPTIGSVKINGNATETVTKSTGYYDTSASKNLIITDSAGNLINNASVKVTINDTTNSLQVSKIDLSVTGMYTITYEVTGYTTKITKNIVVK